MRDSIDSPTSQAFRVREATRGTYQHVQEQLFRAERVRDELPAGSAEIMEWTQLADTLSRAVDLLRAANEQAHAVGSRGAAIRDGYQRPRD